MAFLRKLPVSQVGVSQAVGVSVGLMLACTFNAGGLGQTGSEESAGTGSSSTASTGTGTGGPTGEPPTTEPTSMGPAGEASATGTTGLIDPDTTATATTTVDPSATTVEPMTATTVDPSTSTGGDESSSGGGESTTGCVEKDFFKDGDGDGFGDPKMVKPGCEAPDGYVDNGDDCDDKKAGNFPGADEVCGMGDNDCDGATDEFDPESNVDCGGCKMFLYPVNNRVYYFCSTPEKHWADAKLECEKRTGFLAKDINVAHHDWLLQQVPDNTGPWWIGGSSPDGDSKFLWLDGSTVPYPDARWAMNHPIVLGDDRMVLVSNANQVLPWSSHNGRWYDRLDMDNQPYICESDYMQ